MTQNSRVWCWQLSLISFLAITGTFALSEHCALAQIKQDDTLGANSSIVTPKLIDGQPTDQIDGGATRGRNLFHSFEQFSVLSGNTAYFNNAANINNIITRVTGKSISNIDGILQANGTANLFLINPNGIIFGLNAALNIGGSFVGSTASSLNFADGTKFSATDPQTTPLLTVNVPVGLQFGATPASIHNQSQASLDRAINYFGEAAGLQVQPGKTLALVGGDLVLEGGNLTAENGRIELGSVGSNSLVNIKQIDQGWNLGYENVKNFQDIQLIPRNLTSAYVDVSGQGGGNILVQGRRVFVSGYSKILANTLNKQAANLTVTASDSVELIGGIPMMVGSFGGGDAGNLTINTRKLIMTNGAQVLIDPSSSISNTVAQLTVNASDSVELIGGLSIPASLFIPKSFKPSGLFSSTNGVGNAGNITINTRRLTIQGGAEVSTKSDGVIVYPNLFKPATGQGGNLTVNASDSIELTGTSPDGSNLSNLSASTAGSGAAGNLQITTGQLIVRDGAAITVSSEAKKNANYQRGLPNFGKAGELTITTPSIVLDKGTLTSNSQSGKGGNITLHVRDMLMMRHESKITTNAEGKGDGGKITINAPNGFLVAAPLENNDITANALSDSGGKIIINAKNIFGFVPRTREEVEKLLNPKEPLNPSRLPTNDITAFSQKNAPLNGIVQINSPDVDLSKGLVELPANLVDASQQIAAACNSGGKIERSSFVVTGRGGITADPTQPLIADDAVIADWITVSPKSQNRAGGIHKRVVVQARRNTDEKSQKVNFVNQPTPIVEAQGWVIDANGNVVLVAQLPSERPYNSFLTATSCTAN